MNLAHEVVRAREGRIIINVFVWRCFATEDVAPALLAIEIDVDMPSQTIIEHDRREFEPEFAGRLEFGLADDPVQMLAQLRDTHDCSLAFVCIALGDIDAVDVASAWSAASKNAGADFVTLSVLGHPETAEITPRGAWDAEFFTSDASSLNHPVHLSLNARPLIGYDMADLMSHWRGRTGWVERCAADLGDLNAILLDAKARFARPVEALTLLFTDDQSAFNNQLCEANSLAEGLLDERVLAPRMMVAVNAPFLGHEPQVVELAVLF
jgi:hypothetical protein